MSAAIPNTLLGNILIEPRRMRVPVNSAGRAKSIRKYIDQGWARGTVQAG